MKNTRKIFGALILLTFAVAFMVFTQLKAEASNNCSDDCYYPLTGQCFVSVSRAEKGDLVEWSAEASGGNGNYSWSWTGTDGLSSTHQTVPVTYSKTGTKNATVRITSDGQSVTKTCNVYIEEDEEENDDLGGYCKGTPSNPEVDETVTWTAYPDGGDGDYDYDWSGTDGLDGDDRRITHRYDDDGTKRATVRITSDGESITKTCTVNVDEEDEDDDEDLEAYCKASPSEGDIDERIKWTVYPDGGDGDYDYDWDGDDNLSGDDKSIYHRYDKKGNYDAEVVVRSNGDRVTARCDVDIEGGKIIKRDDDDKIYLSSIPATGIDPNVKTGLFVGGLGIWSAFLGYLFVARRNEKRRAEEILATLEN